MSWSWRGSLPYFLMREYDHVLTSTSQRLVISIKQVKVLSALQGLNKTTRIIITARVKHFHCARHYSKLFTLIFL